MKKDSIEIQKYISAALFPATAATFFSWWVLMKLAEPAVSSAWLRLAFPSNFERNSEHCSSTWGWLRISVISSIVTFGRAKRQWLSW